MTAMIEEQRITVGGLTTQYLTGGEGPPLLLLHGLGDSARSWDRVLPNLARGRRVYAPSFPGFGTTARPVVEYSPAFFTGFATAFLDTLGLAQATVVGNSLGGLVAMRVALAAPGRVTALGLVDSAGLGRDVSLALRLLSLRGVGELAIRWNRRRVGAAQWAAQMAALLFWRYRRVPRAWLAVQYRQARRRGYLEATVATLRSVVEFTGQREILLDQLPGLTMPTLVIWGARDRITPVRQARPAVARLPRGQLALIPDCGHVPQLERPDRFASALTAFLAEQAPTARG